jgi:hypothetical protein
MVPAHVAFQILDANKDGQISAEELRNGGQILIREIRAMRVPKARNALSNQISHPENSAATTPAPAPARTYGVAGSAPATQVAPAPARASTPPQTIPR